MKEMKKIVIVMLLVVILLAQTLVTTTYAEGSEMPEEENGTEVILQVKDFEKIEAGVPIQIDIFVKNNDIKVEGLDCFFELNSNVFEELTESNFTTELDTYVFAYDEEYANLRMIVDESVNEGIFTTVTLIPKVTINPTDIDQEIELLKVCDMAITLSDYTEEIIDELDTSIWILKKVEEEIEPEPLYLSSKIYKIGDRDIRNYEEGDKYISRVNKETRLSQFIEGLETNGDIRVIKEDGTELTANEYVGTGMKLIVTKDEERIEIKIAVTGDLDGNGKVTATDLSTINQAILKLIRLENEYFIAGDTDESNKITATDLSAVNQMVLKVI